MPPVCFVDGAVHFELKPLGDVGRAGLEVGMEEDAAVAVALAPELHREVEVLVELRRLQIAVLGRERLTVDDAVFDRPFLLADFDPASQILAVEERHPVLSRRRPRRLSQSGRHREGNRQGDESMPEHGRSITPILRSHWVGTIFHPSCLSRRPSTQAVSRCWN
jgi:hypothetical protein